MKRRCVFLDRDGVINDPVLDAEDGVPESPLRAGDVHLATGSVDGLRSLRDAGLFLVVVSNQPAAAKGKASLDDLQAVHDRIVELLRREQVEIDDWRYCHHRSEDGCDCRKPAPGMLLAAAGEHGLDLSTSWMIGDTDADIGAGDAVGARTVLVLHPASAHRRVTGRRPDFSATDLARAADIVRARGQLGLPAG